MGVRVAALPQRASLCQDYGVWLLYNEVYASGIHAATCKGVGHPQAIKALLSIPENEPKMGRTTLGICPSVLSQSAVRTANQPRPRAVPLNEAEKQVQRGGWGLRLLRRKFANIEVDSAEEGRAEKKRIPVSR